MKHMGLASPHPIHSELSWGLAEAQPALHTPALRIPPAPKSSRQSGNLLLMAPSSASHTLMLTSSQSSCFTGWTVPVLSQFLDLSTFQVFLWGWSVSS